MNNEQTLIALGFERHTDWDFISPQGRDSSPFTIEHFRLQKGSLVFRAFVNNSNKPTYVSLGVVVNDKGHVDRWRDCVSHDSVAKKIGKECFEEPAPLSS